MPRFLTSSLLIFLLDECLSIPMSLSLKNQKNLPFAEFHMESSRNQDEPLSEFHTKLLQNQKILPFAEFHNYPSQPVSENGHVKDNKEGLSQLLLRAIHSILPERFHKRQRVFIKNNQPQNIIEESLTNNKLLTSESEPIERPLAKLLDNYPINEPSIYLQNLSPYITQAKVPNALQESVGWIQKADQSVVKNNLSLTEYKPERKHDYRQWNPSSRFLVYNPPTPYQTKRAMKTIERCRSARKDKNGDTSAICFTYPKNVVYYYPAYYYYPYYYPYYYWGRR